MAVPGSGDPERAEEPEAPLRFPLRQVPLRGPGPGREPSGCSPLCSSSGIFVHGVRKTRAPRDRQPFPAHPPMAMALSGLLFSVAGSPGCSFASRLAAPSLPLRLPWACGRAPGPSAGIDCARCVDALCRVLCAELYRDEPTGRGAGSAGQEGAVPVSTGCCRLCGMGTGTVRGVGSPLRGGWQCRWLMFWVLGVRPGGLICSGAELLSASSWFLPAARCPVCWESSPACWESSPGRDRHQGEWRLKDGCTALPRVPPGAVVTGHFRVFATYTIK